jgi:AcrR family transcriptional regulator
MDHQPSKDLQWIRPPQQARTHESLERLLDAAEELLRDKDFDDIHIREIARRSDTSVAAFYRRFKDKDALLHALQERRCEEAFATADDAFDRSRWQGADIATILDSVFPFLIDVLRPNEGLYRAIYQRAITDELMRERSVKLTRYVVAGLSALLLERANEIRHPDPPTAISFALIQAIALLLQHYTVGVRDITPTRMNDRQVARELTLSCLGYLGIDGAHAVTRGDRPS